MPKTTAQWALNALCRIADRDPRRATRILEALWVAHPRLLGELAIEAVEFDDITPEEAARALGLSPEEVRSRVAAFRREDRGGGTIVNDEETGVARLADGHVPVWEVIREFRRTGSLDEVAKAFPVLTRKELEAAVSYGEANPAEIEGLIAKYEDMVGRKRTEYPFVQ